MSVLLYELDEEGKQRAQSNGAALCSGHNSREQGIAM